MFEQSYLLNGRTRRTWTVLVAFAGQLLAIGALLASSLFFIEVPSLPQFTSLLLAPPPPPPPPLPAAPAQARAPRETHTTRKFDASQLIAPRTVPEQVAAIKDLQIMVPLSAASGVIGGVPGGIPGGVPGGVPGDVAGGVIGGLHIAPPPPPPPLEKAEVSKPVERIRILPNVQAGLLVHEVEPAYPVLARQARITGVVRLTAVIGRDGTVQKLVLISGHPVLVRAAMDAVKQWLYKPTYLNGIAVEVETEVSVNFHLAT